MRIFALKGISEWAERISHSLTAGEGRFGWSYVETADLGELSRRIEDEGWGALSADEQDCYQSFLLELQEHDYVVYINVPKRGQCTLARVTGEYRWSWEDTDFNHRFPVDPASVAVFDRNDAAVERGLSARLKLQRRWWHIYALDEFRRLLDRIGQGRLGEKSTPESNLAVLAEQLRPLLKTATKKIQRTHPNYDLEHLIELVLNQNPHLRVDRRGGAGDHGADLIVVSEHAHPITGRLEQRTYIIQVKSFVGEHTDLQAVEDIRRAFLRYRDADEGIVISTAARAAPALEGALDRLHQETGKPVQLLIGEDVASFIIRHGWDLMRQEPGAETSMKAAAP